MEDVGVKVGHIVGVEWSIAWEYNMNGVGVRVGHDIEVEWSIWWG